MNDSWLLDLKVNGKGSFAPPKGMTEEEAERLAREADQEREAD